MWVQKKVENNLKIKLNNTKQKKYNIDTHTKLV